MADFIVSARKYRPATFETVIGQKTTTATLKSAIRTNHLAQAYLFCGPRGVGKTTCARIFAKTINCMNITPETEACNQCVSCESFSQNRSYNIHELDAASNNSVDDIRTLIDQVRIPPQVGKYSVYIIDEVHMLSQAAFNAFLKTLEEPPRHAIFILATTEKHKILPTILSRCQIYDFNRIQIKDTVDFLEQIAQKEEVEYEADAFSIIAQKADGAMRDALSIFDQVVSFSDHKITYQKVIENLNVLDYEYYFLLTDAFLNADVSKTLILIDEILNKGFDAHNFINGLSRHFRDLLVCKSESTIQLLELGQNIRDKYLEQSAKCTDDFIFNALEVCYDTDVSFRTSKNPRLHIEIALVKICNLTGKKKNDIVNPDVIFLTGNELEHSVQNKATVRTNKPAGETPQKEQQQPDKSPSLKDTLSKLQSLDNTSKASDSGSLDEANRIVEYAPIVNIDVQKFTEFYEVFIEKIKKSQPRLHIALKSVVPSVQENIIEFSFQNSALLEDFKARLKPKLISFFRENLENESIEISEKLVEAEKLEKPKLYSESEILQEMIKNNPAVGSLKRKFNLDFD